MLPKLLTSDKSWEVKKRAFRIWQRTPHQVAPLSEEQHVCNSCGTEYQGNFCPRCGQSAKVGRFSFKTAFLLFFDIWGIGNRGMFRSIRDLMLRPGYMIRDYLGGCQSAYFPPFKMFFILAAFSLLFSHGINLTLEEEENGAAQTGEAEVMEMQTAAHKMDSTAIAMNGDTAVMTQNGDSTAIAQNEDANEHGEDTDDLNQNDSDSDDYSGKIIINGKEHTSKTVNFFRKVPKYMMMLEKKNPSLFSLMLLLLLSTPLYLFFRRSPRVPDLRYSEHTVALVYTSNMYSLYCMLGEILSGLLSSAVKLFAVYMFFVALHQFTGFSKLRLLWQMILTFLLFFVIIAAIASLSFLIFG